MKVTKLTLMGIFLLLLLLGCSSKEKVSELHIAAAASLTDAMDEIEEAYEKEHDINLKFNFASSGKLAQQIEQGAPVDVFISANENWMDHLEDEELMEVATRETVTGNKLVLIAREDTDLPYNSFEDIDAADLDHIAVGEPESVPAGEYTEAVLKEIGTWNELDDTFVFAKDVRQVLTYVESGNADLGFVYLSDAAISDDVVVLAEADDTMHEPINYPGAVTKDSEVKEEAEDFLAFLGTEIAQDILEKYGFVYE